MYICLCHGVTDRHIKQAVQEGATRFRDLRSQLRVATTCGRCTTCARDCLKQSLPEDRTGKDCSILHSPQQPLQAYS